MTLVQSIGYSKLAARLVFIITSISYSLDMYGKCDAVYWLLLPHLTPLDYKFKRIECVRE